jgi:hypothetical protein
MRDVSPVDESRDRVANATRASNIPVLRKAPSAVQTGEAPPAQKFWTGKAAPNSKVRWDEYSGEPAATGRAGSVSPNTYAKQAASSGGRPMGYQVSVSGPDKRSVNLSERMSRLGTRSPPQETAKYEPWSKTSGRSQIAPPLKDQRSARPVQLPRKALSPKPERLNELGPGALALAIERLPITSDTVHVAADPHQLDTHENPIKPTVPLKVGGTTPPRVFASPTSPTHPAGLGISTYSSPITPAIRKQQRISTPPQGRAASEEPAYTPEQDRQATNSRFSWTTYNSSTTYQHSPPPSPPPPLPIPVPQKLRVVTEPISATSAATSILSRRRPVPQADRLPNPIPQYEPVIEETPGTAKIQTMSSPPSDSPTSPSGASTFSTATTGTSKALPAPPTTLSASDHIAVLESQMEDLRIRRNNVYRLLNDLNNAAPPNPLITDYKRARLAEQRKRTFEDELSDIKRVEHDVGMKLHRAWKKREREDPNQGGSAIWIRRVTS